MECVAVFGFDCFDIEVIGGSFAAPRLVTAFINKVKKLNGPRWYVALVNLVINRKCSLEETFKSNILPSTKPTKQLELLFNYKNIKINEMMEIIIDQRYCFS